MKHLIIFFLISVLISSCSDSPVSPGFGNLDADDKSNLITSRELISDPGIIMRSDNVARLKISDLNNLNQGNENILFKINYSPEENKEYEINGDKNNFNVTIKNNNDEILYNSSADFNKRINLKQNEIYTFEIRKHQISNLKLTDVIYISTKNPENSDNSIIDFSLNSCESCYLSNVKFDSDISTQSFYGSEFYQCKFENIKIENSSFKHVFILNSEFQSVEITNSDFDYATFFKIKFLSSGFYYGCSVNYSKFVSSTLFNSSFTSCSLERASFSDTFLNGVFFETCQMPYTSFKDVMVSGNINDFTMNKVNFSNGSMINYNASSSNLVNSNFTNANFSYTNLSDAEFTGSTFNSTNLNYTNLCGVMGKPAVFSNVSQAGTKCPIKP